MKDQLDKEGVGELADVLSEDRPVTLAEHFAFHRLPTNSRLNCRMISGLHVCPRVYRDELDHDDDEDDGEPSSDEGED